MTTPVPTTTTRHPGLGSSEPRCGFAWHHRVYKAMSQPELAKESDMRMYDTARVVAMV